MGFFPTPLHRLNNLSEKYSDYELYIKRDDHTGLAFGGNKTRKLEYLIHDALTKGCDVVITAGAQQSNHCRQTAAACAVANLSCHLLLGGDEPARVGGNLLLSNLFGATIHYTGQNRKGEDVEQLKQTLENEGRKPYVIPYGGSNATGTLGFVEAAKELKEQLKDQRLEIDSIFFASSSGGTHAGLLLGKSSYKLEATLIGINIDKDETSSKLEDTIVALANEVAPGLKLSKVFTADDVVLDREFDKAGYGVLISEEKEALHELARQEGILLDPVYTARAFYGMLSYLKNGRVKPKSKVLFWHTGGTPANFEHLAR